jgi:hypothetical protein
MRSQNSGDRTYYPDMESDSRSEEISDYELPVSFSHSQIPAAADSLQSPAPLAAAEQAISQPTPSLDSGIMEEIPEISDAVAVTEPANQSQLPVPDYSSHLSSLIAAAKMIEKSISPLMEDLGNHIPVSSSRSQEFNVQLQLPKAALKSTRRKKSKPRKRRRSPPSSESDPERTETESESSDQPESEEIDDQLDPDEPLKSSEEYPFSQFLSCGFTTGPNKKLRFRVEWPESKLYDRTDDPQAPVNWVDLDEPIYTVIIRLITDLWTKVRSLEPTFTHELVIEDCPSK